MPLTASSSRSLRAGVGRDRVSEQRSSCPRPSGRPALLLHHQCCPQQSQHHLDGDTAVQCQPTRAGTAKRNTKRMPANVKVPAKVCVYFQVLSVAGGRVASDGPSLGRAARSRADSADSALCHTALPPLVVWFHLSWLTCSCRPHKLTCLPSLWTLALVGRANNTISFCTNYLMPTTGSVSQLFATLTRTRAETHTHTHRERQKSIKVLNFNLTNTRKETVENNSKIKP